MKEMAISLAAKKEILFDINNGLFSEEFDTNNKCYRDKENDLDIEVQSEMSQLNGVWQFDVTITDNNGDEYLLEEGQWKNLYDAYCKAFAVLAEA